MDDGGITVESAAALLAVSARTIHRRIKQGILQAHKTPTPRGAVWCVHIAGPAVMDDGTGAPVSMTHDTPAVMDDGTPASVEASPPAAVDTEPIPQAMPAGPEVLELVHLVDRLQRDNQQLAGQVGYLQGKLQDAQEQIRLLTVERSEPAAVDAPEPRPRRSWWQRIFRGT